MRVEYTENPLDIRFYIDAHERKVLHMQLQIADLEETVSYAAYSLGKPPVDLEALRRRFSTDHLYSDTRLKELDDAAAVYESELRSFHSGDCTCVPCSCTKCYALDLIGLSAQDPTYAIGKHEMSKIGAAFQAGVDTCEKAIAHLEEHDESELKEDWQLPHLERWEKERHNAIKFLKHYKEIFLNR
jgi:hypothetical protein